MLVLIALIIAVYEKMALHPLEFDASYSGMVITVKEKGGNSRKAWSLNLIKGGHGSACWAINRNREAQAQR